MTAYINRTQHTSNFTIISNSIANDISLSATATSTLIYLISKPPTWRFNAKDVANRFNIGLSKVYKVMKELIAAGYAYYIRTKSRVEWFITDTPKQDDTPKTATSLDLSNCVTFKHVTNEHEYKEIKKQKERNKQHHTTTPPEAEADIVVVSSDELVFPTQLTQIQLKEAKKRIKKAPIDMQQAILTVLAHCLMQGTVKSPVAYLNGLITSANSGTFEPIQAAGASIMNKASIDKTNIKLNELKQFKKSRPETAKAGIAGMIAALRSAH